MNLGNSTRFLCTLALLGACNAQSTATQGALSADPTARSFGIGSYVVEQDGARLLDQYGLQIGTMTISTPAEGRRLLQFEMLDGTTDEVEVHRPKADGTFFAPILPNTVTTAAVADPALAPLFAQHDLTFKTFDRSRLSAAAQSVTPSTVASTTECTGGCGSGIWTCTTPAGCVKAANASLGCTNPSQLPADIYYDSGVGGAAKAWFDYGGTPTQACTSCRNNITNYCNATLGAGNYYSASCLCETDTSPVEGTCWAQLSISEWIASCPRSTCGTVGQYDSVPRQDSCWDPGSCTFQQGTVGCTPYH